MRFDPEKLARDAVQGLQKGDKPGSAADAARNLLHGVKDAVSGDVPSQVLDALRRLIEEARQLLESSGGKNKVLEEGISKAQKLLDSRELTGDAVSRMVAELGALIKDAGKKEPEEAPRKAAEPAARPAEEKRTAGPSKPAAAPAKTVQFTDVKPGAYYYDAVQWAVQNDVVSGTTETTFSPDQNCTRGQALLMIWRAEGSPAPRSRKNPFTDVADSAYYHDAALWAAERGLVTGSTMQPDEPVTRGTMVTFLYRNAGSPAVSGGTAFADVPQNAWFAKPVAWATSRKITSGTSGNTFSPDTVCTRGQIVTFLYKARS